MKAVQKGFDLMKIPAVILERDQSLDLPHEIVLSPVDFLPKLAAMIQHHPILRPV